LHIPQDCSTNIRQKQIVILPHSDWSLFPNFSFSAHALSVKHSVVPLTLSVMWVKWNTHLNLFGPSFCVFWIGPEWTSTHLCIVGAPCKTDGCVGQRNIFSFLCTHTTTYLVATKCLTYLLPTFHTYLSYVPTYLGLLGRLGKRGVWRCIG
jgi:hypothetical protein